MKKGRSEHGSLVAWQHVYDRDSRRAPLRKLRSRGGPVQCDGHAIRAQAYKTCFFQRDPGLIEAELRSQDKIGEFSTPLGMTPEQRAQRIQQITGVDQTTAKSIKALNERAAKLGATIGMTTKQVRDATSWGEPLKVNRTILQGVEDEQWVYGGGQYLYFRNGRLYAIQN